MDGRGPGVGRGAEPGTEDYQGQVEEGESKLFAEEKGVVGMMIEEENQLKIDIMTLKEELNDLTGKQKTSSYQISFIETKIAFLEVIQEAYHRKRGKRLFNDHQGGAE